jgi:tetratricopeptide (TPR) repeat protein/tRNA A-37 threonylcarbamoyl transferase component Bud32
MDAEVTRAGTTGTATGAWVGPYRIVRELGRGGMGTVYLAERSGDEFYKQVALKVLRRGLDTDAIVQRFRHERQILARLAHPFISTLIDGGTTADGLPYLAMEFVEGTPIDEYCEAHRLDTTARLQLFMKICAAVQYAHQNLVVHCDIKPGNVLVTADGMPKLLDFGIAKLLNPSGVQTLALTLDGAPLLTPEYASPEQVRGGAVTTATDVYALGVLLYELLTGRRPYNLTSRTPAEVVRVVCDSVPERPSTAAAAAASTADPQGLRRRLAGDLDTIVLKALSKDPSRRYASADQFAEDIRRHLAGLPVLARPDTLGYRISTFVRRHRTPVAAAGLAVAALIAGAAAATWQARIAMRERAVAERRFEDLRALANVALFDIHDAIRDLPGATPARQLLVKNGLQYLDKLAQDAGRGSAASTPLSASLQRELAGAYVKIGDVQGRPSNPNLGDTAGALASYRKAVATYDAINAAGSADPALRREVARAYQRLSEVLSATGSTEDALSTARRSLEIMQAPVEGEGTEGSSAAELGRELAASHTRVGDLLSATGDTTGALEQRRRALAVMESVAGLAPDDVATIRQLATTQSKLGNQLGNPNFPNVGDAAAALVQLERAVATLTGGLARQPSNGAFRRNLAIVHSNVADVLLALDRRDEALARQRTALAAFEALAAADPVNASARNDLAISVSKIAEMLDAAGRSRDALREYQRALEIHQALAAADPANDSLQLEVASDHNRLATAQVKVGDRAAALANHGRAVELTRGLQQANPANVELRVALGLALAGRADAHAEFTRRAAHRSSRAEDLEAAERDYAASVEIFSALEKSGAIQGTDLETLANNRKALARVRAERSQ